LKSSQSKTYRELKFRLSPLEGAAAPPKEKVAAKNMIQAPNQKSNPKQSPPKTADL